MTNYNDGKWHGWNGGECPVHPETVVDVVLSNSAGHLTEEAICFNWRNDVGNPAEIIAFRVIKEHKGPREWWIYESNNGSTFICLSETDARDRENAYGGRSIRVCEVLPD